MQKKLYDIFNYFLALSVYVNLGWGYIGTYSVSLAVNLIGIAYLFIFIKEPEKLPIANEESDLEQRKAEESKSEKGPQQNIVARFFSQLWSKYLINNI